MIIDQREERQLKVGKPLFEKWSVQIGTAQITPLKQEIAMLDDKEVPQIIS